MLTFMELGNGIRYYELLMMSRAIMTEREAVLIDLDNIATHEIGEKDGDLCRLSLLARDFETFMLSFRFNENVVIHSKLRSRDTPSGLVDVIDLIDDEEIVRMTNDNMPACLKRHIQLETCVDYEYPILDSDVNAVTFLRFLEELACDVTEDTKLGTWLYGGHNVGHDAFDLNCTTKPEDLSIAIAELAPKILDVGRCLYILTDHALLFPADTEDSLKALNQSLADRRPVKPFVCLSFVVPDGQSRHYFMLRDGRGKGEWQRLPMAEETAACMAIIEHIFED